MPGTKQKQTALAVPAKLRRQESTTSPALILSVAAAVIGFVFWRSRQKKGKGNAKSQTATAASKAARQAKLNKAKKGSRPNKKKQKTEKKPTEKKQKKKDGPPSDGGSVMYTNHRFFANPGSAVLQAAPATAPASEPPK